ncbi:translocation/assembly module TamB domain-containing protein [Sandaracinobacteroides hominis]|uniref:translocation/assembly module TamB domain-containing protein n=1 Tax=Sandaracinobacteroides hominis TaxID=2780086 RepID=UPI0018F45AE8|nr:translocation/assembly module TamB domain-containing protein [Sandaracinobacteroides hominis]
MADETGQLDEAEASPPSRRSWWRWLIGILLTLAVLAAAAVPLGLWWLAETPRGRAFVAEQISGLQPKSGVRFQVGRIDGSLLSRFDMVDVVVKDLDGTLAVIPVAHVDWEPITLFGRLVSINRLDVPEVRMLRMWHINPSDPDEPLLPDIDIRIGRFEFPRVVLEKPLLGREEVLAAVGRADIRSGRVLLDARASATAGDRLLLLLDAEPDRDRFKLDADFRGPKGGMVATAAKIDRALTVTANGAGSWSRWRGALTADLGEGEAADRAADLRIQADDGRFRISGVLRHAGLLQGTAANLVSPELAVEATVSRDGDWFDLNLSASSPAISVTGAGRIDTTDNLLEAVRAELELKQPQLVNPALSGSGIRATVGADGPVADPTIRWTANAQTVRFKGDSGPMGADGLVASGEVKLAQGARPLTVPFTATAVRTVGLPPETAALLDRPRLGGTLSFANGTLRGNGLTLTTTRLNASGNAMLFPDGRATAQLDARVARFDVNGLGPVSVRAVANMDSRPGRSPAVNGRIEGRALGLTNSGVRDFLGGLPTFNANFVLAPNGSIAVSNAALKSPNLNVAGARASYDPASGRFTLDAAGRSRAYGPFTVVASGTSTAPRATIRMPSPGFGFGVTNLVADITPQAGGILLVASGDSPQGPLTGRIGVGFGDNRPLTLDIHEASLAGVSATGRLVQAPSGPFVGALVVDGRGLDANLAFTSQGELQRVDVNARALNARLPLETPIGIAKGNARFMVLMVPGKPHVNGSFRFSGVRRGTILLSDISGSANLAGTSGIAKVTANGRAGDGQAFNGTATVQSVADGYAVGLDGQVGNFPLKLERPARIIRTASGWELVPARLILPRGQVVMAGKLGDARELQLQLTDVDLSMLDLVSSKWGLGGKANGQILFKQAHGTPLPTGEANLTIVGLQRAGVTGISIPVDVRVSGRSDGAGLLLGAQLSWRKNQLGRLVVRVEPGAGETPYERFQNGQLSGGIRYNGPVEPLWALAGLEGQELKGAVVIGADFLGTPANPDLNGIARGKGLIYQNATFGTQLTDLAFDGQFSGGELRVNSLTGRAHAGTLKGSGVVRLGLEQSFDMSLELSNARLANSDTMEFTLSGPLRLQGSGAEAALTGDLRVDSARVQLVQMETSEVPQLQVRRVGEVRLPDAEPSLSASNVKLDVRVRADDRVRIEGMGLDSIWRGDIRIRGTAGAPVFLGTATMARGDFSFAGSDFTLTSGRVGFNGSPLDSSINIVAQTQAQDVTAFVTISGTAAKPDIQFSSSPTLPQDEILARLLFGSSVADLSVTEAVQLATAIAGLQSGVDTMGKVRRSVGVDRLRLEGDNAQTGMGTGIAIGKRLTRNVYVEVLTDSQGNTLTTMQLTLSRIWSVLIEVSSVGDSSVNLRYQREY